MVAASQNIDNSMYVPDRSLARTWALMISLSIACHSAILCWIYLIPDSKPLFNLIPDRELTSVEVDLVGVPMVRERPALKPIPEAPLKMQAPQPFDAIPVPPPPKPESAPSVVENPMPPQAIRPPEPQPAPQPRAVAEPEPLPSKLLQTPLSAAKSAARALTQRSPSSAFEPENMQSLSSPVTASARPAFPLARARAGAPAPLLQAEAALSSNDALVRPNAVARKAEARDTSSTTRPGSFTPAMDERVPTNLQAAPRTEAPTSNRQATVRVPEYDVRPESTGTVAPNSPAPVATTRTTGRSTGNIKLPSAVTGNDFASSQLSNLDKLKTMAPQTQATAAEPKERIVIHGRVVGRSERLPNLKSMLFAKAQALDPNGGPYCATVEGFHMKLAVGQGGQVRLEVEPQDVPFDVLSTFERQTPGGLSRCEN